MMKFLEVYVLVLAFLAMVLFVLSFKYENIVAGKKVLGEIDEETKNGFIFHQRFNILLYGLIGLAVYFFPVTRNSVCVIIMVLLVLARGVYYNKKYLNRWTIKK